MVYEPFRKNFYIESYEIARLSKDEVRDLRAELEGIKCRGKDVPKPIKTWAQAGLSNRVMELIRRSGFEKPMPIQCQVGLHKARIQLTHSLKPPGSNP